MPVPPANGGRSADKVLYLEQQAPEMARLLRHPISQAQAEDLVRDDESGQTFFFVDTRGMNTTAFIKNRDTLVKASQEKIPKGLNQPKKKEFLDIGKPDQMVDLFGALRLNEVLKTADLGTKANQIVVDAGLRGGLPDNCLVRSLRTVNKADFIALLDLLRIQQKQLADAIVVPWPHSPFVAETIANHFCKSRPGTIYKVNKFTITDLTAEVVVDALNKISGQLPLTVEEVFPLDTCLTRKNRILPLERRWGNLI